MRERFSLGDYSGALVVAESILEEDPNDAEALKLLRARFPEHPLSLRVAALAYLMRMTAFASAYSPR